MPFQMLRPMLPTLVYEIPSGEQWLYEIKFDGYRTILHWNCEKILLQSRNLNSLGAQFPEVINGLLALKNQFIDFFPLVFDCELCVLKSNYKADFEVIQGRGRLQSSAKIEAAGQQFPAKLCVFDILQLKGKSLHTLPFSDRKKQLKMVLDSAGIPSIVEADSSFPLLGISEENDPVKLWQIVKEADSEGIIAKKSKSVWQSGRTKDWLKIKNNKLGLFIITGFDPANGFFHVSVLRDKVLYPIGVFSHGLEGDERDAIIQIMHKNKNEIVNGIILVEPRICVELEYLELYKEQLRQPRFVRFRFDQTWEDATWEALQINKGN